MALTYLKDAPDADLPKAVKISESDPGTDVGAYRWWGDPLPHGGPYTSVVLQLRNAANDGYIDASQSVPWSALTGTPTTLAGYGITDAASSDDLQDAVGPAWETLVDAATVEWDTLGAPYSQAKVTLGGNRTLDLQNMVAGAHGVLMVIQDGTGSRTLTLDGSNLHTITLSTAASAVDLLGWWYDGTTIRWAMLDQAGGGGSGVAVEEDGVEEGTGIDRFDFTGDIALSVSGSQATVNVDLSAKAPLASPTFTGTPAAPTAAADTNTTQIATTAYVQTELADFHLLPAVNAQTGTSYTAVLGDANDLITLTNAGAITFTVPANGSVAYPVGTTLHVMQGGAGAVTITPDTGVTINVHTDFTLVTDGQYAVASVTKTATNTWVAYGKLV
jgi:hypothetical protein